jgi:ADP-heptose:LPS heptosyltransferase
LLVVELWGVGDLAVSTPFLQVACRQYAVTLLAKPFASDFKPRFWPDVEVIASVAPWTAFRGKYRLHRWPWGELTRVARCLRRQRFDCAVSARWDPRDHFIMAVAGVRRRIGFPRLGSVCFLTEALPRPGVAVHRYEYWRQIARSLELELPARNELVFHANRLGRTVVVHSGASQPTKVWPLERYRVVVERLKRMGLSVQVACDAGQRDWWRSNGVADVQCPASMKEWLDLVSGARAFVGNDSGPGHAAAIAGVPTFTLFGNQFSERFAPLHPASEWIEGKPCPYKPCFDSCRFPAPNCLWDVHFEEVWPRIEGFVRKHVRPP